MHRSCHQGAVEHIKMVAIWRASYVKAEISVVCCVCDTYIRICVFRAALFALTQNSALCVFLFALRQTMRAMFAL